MFSPFLIRSVAVVLGVNKGQLPEDRGKQKRMSGLLDLDTWVGEIREQPIFLSLKHIKAFVNQLVNRLRAFEAGRGVHSK